MSKQRKLMSVSNSPSKPLHYIATDEPIKVPLDLKQFRVAFFNRVLYTRLLHDLIDRHYPQKKH